MPQEVNPLEKIRIRLPEGSRTATATDVTFLDGTPVPNVRSIEIQPLSAQSIPTAKIEVYLDGLDIEAIPFLGLESLQMAAAMQGYALVPIEDEE